MRQQLIRSTVLAVVLAIVITMAAGGPRASGTASVDTARAAVPVARTHGTPASILAASWPAIVVGLAVLAARRSGWCVAIAPGAPASPSR